MSQQVALEAAARVGSGKGEARSLRRAGRVPAVAYGQDLQPTPVSVDARELYHALHTGAGENAIIRLDIDGESHLAMARELQRHPVRRDVLHVDFVTIDRNRKIQVDVPIHLTGESPGVTEGGVADLALFTLAVEVLPLEVPDQIVLDISDMTIGDVKRVEDLPLPEGVTALDDPETTVVSVTVPQVEVPEVEAEAEEVEEGAEEIAEEAGEDVDADVSAEEA
jgi:large subunit ribosomal protein L25